MDGGGLAIDDFAVRCPNCGVVALKDELDVDHSQTAKASNAHIKANGRLAWNVVQPKELVSAMLWSNDEQEMAIRMAAWHQANHRDRRRLQADRPKTVLESENLLALDRLLGDTHVARRILSAEISRELGLFAACIWKLQSCASEEFEWVVRPICEAAAAGITTVIRID
jgi:hypothetical protein